MRKSEIVVGGIYTNGKVVREIVNEVNPRYFIQKDTDCVEYAVRSGKRTGLLAIMTRARFAAWAKSRVNTGDQNN